MNAGEPPVSVVLRSIVPYYFTVKIVPSQAFIAIRQSKGPNFKG